MRQAPLLGENTNDVLRDLLKLTPERIAELKAQGVIESQP